MAEGSALERLPFERPLGARPCGEGQVTFRVWAPRAERVSVRGGAEERDLEPVGLGIHEATLPARAGEDYWLVINGRDARPDPCSRWQPDGILGPSRVLDTGLFEWSDSDWGGLCLTPTSVLYELHVGTFSEEGTFEGVIPQLDALAELGVDAIELMPVGTFPGDRNWGYDGIYISAAHAAYGGPIGLARLVDAAHRRGLGVLLDVVYNHVGPGGDALAAFGPYFSGKYHTPWGDAINYDDIESGPVREWAIQSATGWVEEFHVDGLRLDAVHAIYDSSPRTLTCELTRRVRASTAREVVLIAETDRNDAATTEPCGAGGQGFDAQWADDLHHALHSVITGERDGYYADYGSIADVATALQRPFVYEGRYSTFLARRRGAPLGEIRPSAFVVSAQNHDQVGNRALGDRLAGEQASLAAFCVLLSPWVAMLFMGEEYGETNPFQFFTDHIDPGIAEATRQGRRREFARFVGFSEEVPDPQSPETMERSRLDRAQANPDIRDRYRRLIALRRELGDRPVAESEADEGRGTLCARRGYVWLYVNFAEEPRHVATHADRIALEIGGASWADGVLRLPARSAAALR